MVRATKDQAKNKSTKLLRNSKRNLRKRKILASSIHSDTDKITMTIFLTNFPISEMEFSHISKTTKFSMIVSCHVSVKLSLWLVRSCKLSWSPRNKHEWPTNSEPNGSMTQKPMKNSINFTSHRSVLKVRRKSCSKLQSTNWNLIKIKSKLSSENWVSDNSMELFILWVNLWKLLLLIRKIMWSKWTKMSLPSFGKLRQVRQWKRLRLCTNKIVSMKLKSILMIDAWVWMMTQIVKKRKFNSTKRSSRPKINSEATSSEKWLTRPFLRKRRSVHLLISMFNKFRKMAY